MYDRHYTHLSSFPTRKSQHLLFTCLPGIAKPFCAYWWGENLFVCLFCLASTHHAIALCTHLLLQTIKIFSGMPLSCVTSIFSVPVRYMMVGLTLVYYCLTHVFTTTPRVTREATIILHKNSYPSRRKKMFFHLKNNSLPPRQFLKSCISALFPPYELNWSLISQKKILHAVSESLPYNFCQYTIVATKNNF